MTFREAVYACDVCGLEGRTALVRQLPDGWRGVRFEACRGAHGHATEYTVCGVRCFAALFRDVPPHVLAGDSPLVRVTIEDVR